MIQQGLRAGRTGRQIRDEQCADVLGAHPSAVDALPAFEPEANVHGAVHCRGQVRARSATRLGHPATSGRVGGRVRLARRIPVVDADEPIDQLGSDEAGRSSGDCGLRLRGYRHDPAFRCLPSGFVCRCSETDGPDARPPRSCPWVRRPSACTTRGVPASTTAHTFLPPVPTPRDAVVDLALRATGLGTSAPTGGRLRTERRGRSAAEPGKFVPGMC